MLYICSIISAVDCRGNEWDAGAVYVEVRR